MRKTAVFKDDIFLEHQPGYQHVECPERLAVIYDQLKNKELADRFLFPEISPAGPEHLQLVHTPAHVARVADTAGQAFASLDPDTQTSARSYEAACLAAGAVIRGAEMLMAGEVDNCFALVRPPGHHAEADRAMGFCLFNNIAVGARYALDVLNVRRVLILDWDLHHGNGTQHSFYDTERVLYFSTHQYPYYPGSGGLAESGTGRGLGFTVNVPLSGGQNDQAYGAIFREILGPVVRQYQPELIMVSAGFDIYVGDPLGTMAVTARGFGYLARVLVDLADEVCNGRLLFALEGGYNLEGQRDGVLAVLGELAGVGGTSNDDFKDIDKAVVEVPGLEQARNIAKKYWNL